MELSALITGIAVILYIGHVVHDVSTRPPSDPRWQLDCPDREPWMARSVHTAGGMLRTTDAQGRDVILTTTCTATNTGSGPDN